MQDWEIECADPNRVGEFLDYYAAGTADDDERFTLMALILGSFEEYHGLHEPDSVLWERIRSVLAADIDLHRDQIEYYQCLDAETEEEYFPITKLIRQIQTRPEQGADGTPTSPSVFHAPPSFNLNPAINAAPPLVGLPSLERSAKKLCGDASY